MNNLKKIIICLLFISVVFSLVACSSKEEDQETNNGNKTANNIIVEESDYYRSIMVADYKGTVDIERSEGDFINAYEGLSLNDGDDVKVNDHSDLTLNLDSDKHLYADENTHFWIIASGSEGNTKTKIKLEKGSVLCQIKNKLLENEFFEIETASSTMSVRGTVFRVSIIKGVKEDEVYELVEVFNGGVATLISENGDSVSLNPGEAALIKEKQDGSDARFVKDDEIDEDFWSSSDLNFNIETDEGEGSPILKISYEKLSEGALDMLVEIADEGQQELVIEKEVLEEVKETGHNYKVTQRIEPTCTKDGLIISKCSICNQEMQEVLPALGHDYKETKTLPTCTEDGSIVNKCSRCGDTTSEKLLTTGHNLVTKRTEPTCEEEGLELTSCTKCNYTKRQTLSKLPHNMEVVAVVPKTNQVLMLEENSESTQNGSSLIIKNTVKYTDGYEEVTLDVSATEECKDCHEQQDIEDECYLVYDSTRIYKRTSFKMLEVSTDVLKKFESLVTTGTINSEILSLLSSKFDCDHSNNNKTITITDLNWISNSENEKILDYSIKDSTEESSVNRILTLNNVKGQCSCGEYITIEQLYITLNEHFDTSTDKDSLSYNPTNGYILSPEVVNSLNNYFVHDYVEIVKNVEKISSNNNSIVVNITYGCGYKDCIFTRHGDRVVKNANATIDNEDNVSWGDNNNITQEPVVNSLVLQIFEGLFGTPDENYTYSYKLSGEVTRTHIRRNWNGDISVGYLFKVEETKTRGEEVIKNIYPIYAIYDLKEGENIGVWSIMSPLQIQNNTNLMNQLQERADQDIKRYQSQRSLLFD